MKKRTLVLLSLLAGASTFTAITPLVTDPSVTQHIVAQEIQQQQHVALGASLSEQEKEQTLDLLGASEIAKNNISQVDGNLIHKYLQDGSTEETPVYSSVSIEPRESGYGVQIQILTPDNILQIAPQTYQNAAITAGAENVLIKIATIHPVTGEGALTGLYSIYESSGQVLNDQNIQIAQKEMRVIGSIQENNNLTNRQINKLQTDIKLNIGQFLQDNEGTNENDLKSLVLETIQAFENEHGIILSEESIEELFTWLIEYAQTETASSSKTNEQLNSSINSGWTTEQAIDYWEATFLSDINGDRFIHENYDRSYWSEVSNNESTIVLHLRNAGAGGNYYVFEKSDTVTHITLYSGNASYPDDPTIGYWVNNEDYNIYQEYDYYNELLTEFDEDGTVTETPAPEKLEEESTEDTQNNEDASENQDTSVNSEWTMEQAIDYWEATFLSGTNSERIIRENYDRSYWSEVSNYESTIVLHLRNAGAGGNYYVFEKSDTVTHITLYSGNASYPDDPTIGYWVNNEDYNIYQEYDYYNELLIEFDEDGTTTETPAPEMQDEESTEDASENLDTPTNSGWTTEQAIDYWEATFLSGINGERIIGENYDRSYWSEVSNNESTIVLHLRNAGAGGNYYVFEKSDTVTHITLYSGNASYPDDPTTEYWVNNEDNIIYQEHDYYSDEVSEDPDASSAPETQASDY